MYTHVHSIYIQYIYAYLYSIHMKEEIQGEPSSGTTHHLVKC